MKILVKPKRRYRPKLTMEEARIAVREIYLNRKSRMKVTEELGYSPITAATHATIEKNPNFIAAKNELQKEIKDFNPNIFKKIAKQVDAGIEANFITKNGIKPDNFIRLKYCEFVSRIFGFLNDTTTNASVLNVNQIISIVQQSRQERGLPLDG